MSTLISKAAVRGIVRLGNILIPGDGEMPSYEEYGGYEHVDDLLMYAPKSDIGDLGLLLTILSFMPKFVLVWLVGKMAASHGKGNGLWILLRQLDMGIRGIVLSTYYTEKAGASFSGTAPLDGIDYSITRMED